jgi:hypothetical protein
LPREIAEPFNSVGFVEIPEEKAVSSMAHSVQTERESDSGLDWIELVLSR